MSKNKLLLATGNSLIDDAIKNFKDYEVIETTLYRDNLEKLCVSLMPDILLVTEMLNGTEILPSILLRIKTSCPNIRIVYLPGKINMKNEKEVDALALLVMAGVYDIIDENKMTLEMVKKTLENKKKEQDVEFILKAANKNLDFKAGSKNIEFIIPEEYEKIGEDIRNNLYVISSIKPGTGKSFISVNIAAAIAEYGIDTKEGKRPTVGLIEADLQNLSLGTLLQIEDNDKNIKTVMDKIGEVVSSTGEIFDDSKIEEVNEFIKNSFVPYYKIKNLKALVGSQLTFEEIEKINSIYYTYLIDSMINEFDVLIVDTNSALTHITTYPLLHMAKCCYYIINLDFNNVRNNLRYKDTLNEMGIQNKVKYILNEDIKNEESSDYTGTSIEPLIFTAEHLEDSGFKLEARIPVIPKTVFLNRLYSGTPIVLDNNKRNEEIKHEILKIANQIYPIKNFKETDENSEERHKHKRSFFGK